MMFRFERVKSAPWNRFFSGRSTDLNYGTELASLVLMRRKESLKGTGKMGLGRFGKLAMASYSDGGS